MHIILVCLILLPLNGLGRRRWLTLISCLTQSGKMYTPDIEASRRPLSRFFFLYLRAGDQFVAIEIEKQSFVSIHLSLQYLPT